MIPIFISYSTSMRELRNIIGSTWSHCIKSHYKPDNSTYNNRTQKPVLWYLHSKSTDWFLHNDKKYPILPQNGQTRFFLKNRASSLFKLDDFTSSCKKSENSYDPISRKALDKRTYIQYYWESKNTHYNKWWKIAVYQNVKMTKTLWIDAIQKNINEWSIGYKQNI